MMQARQHFILAAFIVVLVTYLAFANTYEQSAHRQMRHLINRTCTQWVVVTTIHAPSETIMQLASFPSWCVVVVGDLKTPSDWSWPNVTFLSLATQAKLGYRLTSLLSTSHYSRKNIGYLFAIEHGAQVIYETDDDNFPIAPPSALLAGTFLHYPSQNALVNPYAHFGQATIWPRGYPLQNIADSQAHTLLHLNSSIGIYQGLANGDPDVDALFRLTRKSRGVTLNITFDANAPGVVLPPGVFAPFNSQNTLYHYSAFWGLLIPVSTTFRVCDIWRGYWVQRLLWDIGRRLAFTPPSVLQNRNMHNYFRDFLDEKDLYDSAANFISMLLSWESNSRTLSQRIHELTHEIAKHGFWSGAEETIADAWLADLVDVGYKFPEIDIINEQEDSGAVVKYHPRKQPTSVLGVLEDYCI